MADPDWRALVDGYGPVFALPLIFLFMVWVRIRPADRIVTASDVAFSGNDPWYHARMVQYAVKYFPETPDFDAFSYFPYGTGRHSGFGGLFDQLIAFASLLVGLGDPTPHQVEVVTAYSPAVFGALTVIPTYLVVKRLTDRLSALVAGFLLALVNGQFLTRTIIGVSDHQSAEAFFGTLALAGFIYALETSYREQPTWADIQDRNWRVLRKPVLAGIIGGFAVSSYLMMWGPGVFLVFAIGVFVVIQLIRTHLRNESTEYLTFATTTAFIPAAVLTLLYAKTSGFSATAFSLLQPLVLIGIAVGSLVMWQLSERFRREAFDPRYYPIAIGGLIAGGILVASVVQPQFLSMLRGLVIRIYSFGLLTSPTARTVAEIAPATPSDAWDAYGALFAMALFGLSILIYRVLRRDRPIELLVVLWSLTITSAYFTMIRFGYYMGVIVAVLAGFTIWWVGKTANFDELRGLGDIENYQLLVVLILLVAVVPGNVIAVSGTTPPVWETADRSGGANSAWQNELDWVRGNTPEIPMEYYAQTNRPETGDYEYPSGAYGVMSWWDYGHWITYTGHRIPNANPFQQGPRQASAYLLAQDETRANLILEALPSLESPGRIPDMSNEDLRKIIESQPPQRANEDTRYVMIDDQMAAGKFSAIATWTGPGPGSFFSRQEFQVGNTRAQLIGTNDRYRNTMLARLYLQDARGLSHYRLVHESGDSAIVSVARQTAQGFESTNFIHRRLTSQVFAAVQQRQDLFFYNVHQPARVKTFERVPGATLTGQVNTTNATTVIATLQLQTNRNRNFTYVQSVQTDSSGRFEMTVPYATTNTVEPADGGTDSGVEALSNYQLFAGNPFQPTARGQTPVPEPAIYDGATIQVEMISVERPSGNETEGSNSSALGGPLLPEPSASLDTHNPALGSGGTHPLSAAPRRAVDG